MLIIFMTISVALIAVLSAIGVCERCKMQSGGVYYLLSHVMGARIGAAIGILYCFGQVSNQTPVNHGQTRSMSVTDNHETVTELNLRLISLNRQYPCSYIITQPVISYLANSAHI